MTKEEVASTASAERIDLLSQVPFAFSSSERERERERERNDIVLAFREENGEENFK